MNQFLYKKMANIGALDRKIPSQSYDENEKKNPDFSILLCT